MRRIYHAIKRLWFIATCDHMNSGRQIDFDDTTWICVCRRCGTVMQIGIAESDRGRHTAVVQRAIDDHTRYATESTR